MEEKKARYPLNLVAELPVGTHQIYLAQDEIDALQRCAGYLAKEQNVSCFGIAGSAGIADAVGRLPATIRILRPFSGWPDVPVREYLTAGLVRFICERVLRERSHFAVEVDDERDAQRIRVYCSRSKIGVFVTRDANTVTILSSKSAKKQYRNYDEVEQLTDGFENDLDAFFVRQHVEYVRTRVVTLNKKYSTRYSVTADGDRVLVFRREVAADDFTRLSFRALRSFGLNPTREAFQHLLNTIDTMRPYIRE